MVAAGIIGLEVTRAVLEAFHEDLDIRNNSPQPWRFTLEILIRSDFADIFEVKGKDFSDGPSRLGHSYRSKTMAKYTLSDMSKKMREIDFAMLFTKSDGGDLAGRPMSNNGEVEYQGDSFFFAYDSTRTVQDIGREPKVALSYQGSGSLLGKPPLFIAIEGTAVLIRDKGAFADRWSKDLKRWFPEGVDTPGLVMIKVAATRIHYWDGFDEGEVQVRG